MQSRLKPANRRRVGGFTYPELLLATGVLAVAGSLVVALAGDVRGRSAGAATQQLLDATASSLALYQQVYARLPDLPPPGEQLDAHNAALTAVLRRTTNRTAGPTLGGGVGADVSRFMDTGQRLFDAWGTPIALQRSGGVRGGAAALVSAGPDGSFSTRGDNVYSDPPTPPSAGPAPRP